MNAWLRARRRKTKHGETVTLACACGCKATLKIITGPGDILEINGVAAPMHAWWNLLGPICFPNTTTTDFVPNLANTATNLTDYRR